ncbi:Asp-tRNA(Asn)/Glu-tRNA(Gln) amidotransferase subunit GatC [Candidatus Parcubacteria bacterium]|nr:Asp-tRNA(Asn)/Glu-tRNA(Gln) amidotransferase subunit GatC [Candidatus Parcubacteria bacterium]
MDKDKVLDLAKLSRIEIGEDEAEKLSHEFETIIRYVGEVKEVEKNNKEEVDKEDFPVRNVMREDAEPHESGIYTEKILSEAPSREGQFIKVKKIL